MKIWHPYTQMQTAPVPIPIARAEGAWLYAEDGHKYLDAISSWWVTLHGHAHPRIAEAIGRQARTLEQVILAGFTHRPATELAERLLPRLPGQMRHVFYSDDGSTAVEVALKMAVQYWHNRGRPERRRIVALDHAYHGDTAAAMSVSAPSPFTAPFAQFLFPVDRVATAYCYHCPVGLTRDRCAIDCLEALERRLGAHGEETAAVIVEPLLQGAGGMIVQPPEFLRGIRALCDRYGVLLIADEVLTGFGRTGALFACGGAGVAPDILCLSKGLSGGFLPLAATACTEAVYAAFLDADRRKTLFHGHSFTGNPLGCAAALASLDIFDTEPVEERRAAIAAHHAHWLERLRRHPRVGDIRQAGTVAVVELTGGGDYLSALGPRLQRFFLDRGVVLRPLGPVIYLLPPYCITAEELDLAWNAVAAALDANMA